MCGGGEVGVRWRLRFDLEEIEEIAGGEAEKFLFELIGRAEEEGDLGFLLSL